MAEPGSSAPRWLRARLSRRSRGDTDGVEVDRSDAGSQLEAVPSAMGEWKRHLELADLPPAVADKVAFEEAAPKRVRNDKVPAEAQEIFRDVWNDIVADVYDEMAGRGRKQLFDKEVIQHVLQ